MNPEQVEFFASIGLGQIEQEINEWLKQNTDIEVVDRKFAMCTVPDDEYRDITRTKYAWVIVYREKSKKEEDCTCGNCDYCVEKLPEVPDESTPQPAYIAGDWIA